jgi:hypothetical protein
MAIRLTPALVTRFRDEMREHPLREGEIRRLMGLGRHDIASASTDIGAPGFARLYSLTIDGLPYQVCVPGAGTAGP